MNILIADHDLASADRISQEFNIMGHRAEICTSCEEALTRIKSQEFDLVLLDLLLSDGGGEKCIAHIKEIRPRVEIVAMTEHNSRELELKVRSQGILFYMIKPFEINYLKVLADHISQIKIARDPQPIVNL